MMPAVCDEFDPEAKGLQSASYHRALNNMKSKKNLTPTNEEIENLPRQVGVKTEGVHL